MQHQQAADEHLVEQYLLNEMAPPAREEFEDHFFDCRECASELKATSAFLEAARLELREPEKTPLAVVRPVHTVRSEPKGAWLSWWNPTFAFGALAACLLLMAYQNLAVLPRLTNEVARLEAPEIPATLSLMGASTRGGTTPAVVVDGAKSLILLVDIPERAGFSSYVCQLLSPSQEVIWTGQVSPERAKDTVSIRVPAFKRPEGQYALVVRGARNGENAAANEELARYSFLLHSDSTGLSRK